MKTKYTRDEINTFIRGLDVRAKTLSDTQLDNVVNRGYAELMTVSSRLFSNEEVISLDEYYESGETKLSFDVEDDATEVYDVYTTIEGDETDKTYCDEVVQGIGIYRNNDVAYRDNRYVGRVHLDLDTPSYSGSTQFDNCIVKYYYTPRSTDEDVMMSSQVWATFTDAMWASLNYFLKDVESESQKRASMERTSAAVMEVPEDIPDRGRAVFGGM